MHICGIQKNGIDDLICKAEIKTKTREQAHGHQEGKADKLGTGTECVLSCFSRVQLFGTLWTVARQTPLSMGFSRQEYWSGLPCPPPGDLPDPGIGPVTFMFPGFGRWVLYYQCYLGSPRIDIYTLFYKNFSFCIGIQPINNVVIVSGEKQRDSAIHIHAFILSQTPLPSSLLYNIEQSSICNIADPCWLECKLVQPLWMLLK